MTPFLLRSIPAIRFTVTETTHGLSLYDVVRHNGSNWVAASSSAEATLSEPPLMVINVIDANTIEVGGPGLHYLPSHGFTPGSKYYLSTAGNVTTTEPAISNLVFIPIDANNLLVVGYEPHTPGGPIPPAWTETALGSTTVDLSTNLVKFHRTLTGNEAYSFTGSPETAGQWLFFWTASGADRTITLPGAHNTPGGATDFIALSGSTLVARLDYVNSAYYWSIGQQLS